MLDCISNKGNNAHDEDEKGRLIGIFTSLLGIYLKIKQHSDYFAKKNAENWKNHPIYDAGEDSNCEETFFMTNVAEETSNYRTIILL